MIPSFVTADPRSSGLARPVGSTAMYVATGAITPLFKYGTGNTDWCTVPSGGSATPTTSDPRSAGRTAAVGTVVMYVAAQVGLLLRKVGAGATDWATVPVISGGGGTPGPTGATGAAGATGATGPSGPAPSGTGFVTVTAGVLDIPSATIAATVLSGTIVAGRMPALTGDVVTSSGAVATSIAASAVDTSKMGGDVTTAGKTLLQGADAAAQRLSLGVSALGHTHDAADVVSGTVDTARLGSGSATVGTFLRGDQTWATPAGGSGSAVAGTATADFGAYPGAHEVIVAVADATISSGSVITCAVRPEATADHSADEHYAEAGNFACWPQSIVAGVGFDLVVRYEPVLRDSLAFPGAARTHKAHPTAGNNYGQQPTIVPTVGGSVPRITGQWTFQWIRI